jgi:YD repeat-containing protein
MLFLSNRSPPGPTSSTKHSSHIGRTWSHHLWIPDQVRNDGAFQDCHTSVLDKSDLLPKKNQDDASAAKLQLSETTYDAFGRPVAKKDGLGVIKGVATTYDYNANWSIASVTDPLVAVRSYGYDEQGNKTSITDPKGTTWEFEYHDVGMNAGKMSKKLVPLDGAPTVRSHTLLS